MSTSVKKRVVSAADSKVLVRYRLSDTTGMEKDHLPALQRDPTDAIIKGDASEANGKKGLWTGVYGHSEQSIAIYAVSPVYAGWFEGEVHDLEG